MKKYFLVILLFGFYFSINSQEVVPAFKDGEWLRYEMSYSGFLTAGKTILEVKEDVLNGKSVLRSSGKGWTTGIIKWFFKVNDKYDSFFDKDSIKPYLFKRDIDENGYKIKRNTRFNYYSQNAEVKDFIKKKDSIIGFDNVQDVLSAFYYLRSKDLSQLQKNEAVSINVFLDYKIYPFKLRFLGEEILDTKFGKVSSLVFRPVVQSGRVFKAEESVTIWVTNDDNKVPIKMEAELSVGSLRAELEAYKGLANSFKIIFD